VWYSWLVKLENRDGKVVYLQHAGWSLAAKARVVIVIWAVSNDRWPSEAVDEHRWKVIEPRVEDEDGVKTV